MGSSMNKKFGSSRGQVMVLYAAAFAFALVGAIAMSTDVAVKYINWQHGQKVVDAAALAGANYLSGGITYTDSTGTAYPTQSGCNGENSGTTAAEVATQVACTYAVKNGLAASTITISEPSATQIEVVAAQTVFPTFSRRRSAWAHTLQRQTRRRLHPDRSVAPPTSCFRSDFSATPAAAVCLPSGVKRSTSALSLSPQS